MPERYAGQYLHPRLLQQYLLQLARANAPIPSAAWPDYHFVAAHFNGGDEHIGYLLRRTRDITERSHYDNRAPNPDHQPGWGIPFMCPSNGTRVVMEYGPTITSVCAEACNLGYVRTRGENSTTRVSNWLPAIRGDIKKQRTLRQLLQQMHTAFDPETGVIAMSIELLQSLLNTLSKAEQEYVQSLIDRQIGKSA